MTFKIKSMLEAKQAMIRAAYRGLRAQGWKRAVHPLWSESCVWRVGTTPATIANAEAGTVRCCAVGWLISDEAIAWRPALTQARRYGAWEHLAIYNDGLSDELRPWVRRMFQPAAAEDFLFMLQRAHDCSNTPEAMKAAFDRLVADYEVKGI